MTGMAPSEFMDPRQVLAGLSALGDHVTALATEALAAGEVDRCQTWEMTVASGVVLLTWTGRPGAAPETWVTPVRLGGKGRPRSITLTVEEVELYQRKVAPGNEHHNPYVNGFMRRTDVEDLNPAAPTDDQLRGVLALGDDAEFAAAYEALGDVARQRLIDMASVHDSMSVGRARFLAEAVAAQRPHHVGFSEREERADPKGTGMIA